MAYRGFRLTAIFILTIASAMSFLVLRNLDESAVIGPGSVLRIDETENRATAEAVSAAISHFAKAHGVDVAREVPDLTRPDERRTLYLTLAPGHSPRNTWLSDGYPAFSRGITTHVLPDTAARSLDPRGTYLVFGPETKAQALQQELGALGLHGRTIPYVTSSRAFQFFGHGALLWCFIIAVLVVVVLMSACVLSNAKTYGILRLHGHGLVGCLRHDLRLMGRALIRDVGLVLLAIGTALYAYNDAHHFALFGAVSAGFGLVLTALAAAAYGLSLALAWRTPIIEAIKGKIPTTGPLILAYGCRITALVASLAVGLSALDSISAMTARQSQARLWHQAGATSAILLNGSLGSQSERLESDVGKWLAGLDGDGSVMMVAPTTLGQLGPSQTPETPVLIVNDAYLRRHAVALRSGHQARADKNHVTLFRPTGVPTSVESEISTWLNLIATKVKPVREARPRPGQQLFTYGAGMNSATRAPMLRDPLIVALPTQPILKPSQYTAWASQRSVLFPDPSIAVKARDRDERLRTDILGVEAVSSRAALEERADARETQLGLWNFFASLAVAVLAAMCASMLYFQRNAQRTFARYLHGWSWRENHVQLIVAEAALMAGLFAAAVWTRTTQDAPVTGPPGTPPWSAHLIVALSVVILTAATATTAAVGTLHRLSSRQLREVSTHA